MSVPDVIEHIAMELRHRGPNELQAPITADYFKRRVTGRTGIPLDLLTWIALAAASGVVGGLAYDALKGLIKSMMSQGLAPKQEIYVESRKGWARKKLKLSEEQIDFCIGNLIKYTRRRLSVVKKNVKKERGLKRSESAKTWQTKAGMPPSESHPMAIGGISIPDLLAEFRQEQRTTHYKGKKARPKSNLAPQTKGQNSTKVR